MASVMPSYNTDRIVLGKQLPLDTPLSVILDTSERCNFKCSYCFRSSRKNANWGFAASEKLMPMNIFKRTVAQLKQFPQKIKLISLSGHGEPLCNPHIAEMVRFLRNQDASVQIDMHTNASLLTEENATQIAKAGFSRIVISLQGLDTAAYKRTCGVDINYQRLYHSLKLLFQQKNKSLRIHIKIEDIALDQNSFQEDEQKFYSMFENIADSIFIEKAVPLWKDSKLYVDSESNKFGDEFDKVNYCPLLFYKIMVAPDGEIYPCTSLPTPMSLGNIQNITLQQAWNGRKRMDFLKRHLLLTRYKNDICSDCFIPVNTITSEVDRIDPYRDEIMERLEHCFNERED